jgi:predicted nuclease with TOPRIM domain
MACENHEDLKGQMVHQARQIAALADRVTKLETESARYDEKIDRIFADIDAIKEILKAIQENIADLKERPAKKWDQVVSIVIAGGVGAFISWLLAGRI